MTRERTGTNHMAIHVDGSRGVAGRRRARLRRRSLGGRGGRPIAGWRGPLPDGRPPDAGAVLLETALAIPVLLAVAAALAWGLGLAATTAALGDAARMAARDLARGEGVDVALGRAASAMPQARLTITEQGDLVLVSAEQDVSAPVPIIRGLSITLRQDVAVPREWSMP